MVQENRILLSKMERYEAHAAGVERDAARPGTEVRAAGNRKTSYRNRQVRAPVTTC